jgi:alkanesulfonate monooxygenase SsuD/methylene tetrahydromethanopterin reductase-like flavin-dependent oxidoreductase (luciferase family)
VSHPEFGVVAFGERRPGAVDARALWDDLIELAVVADAAGLDFFGLGEHHRPDFAVSSPEMLLAAIGPLTQRIRLTSALTVLPADDPIRVLERFGTLDELSGGRAEVMIGRGAYKETFELFGVGANEPPERFVERARELLAIRDGSGTFGPHDRRRWITPQPRPTLPVWIGAGGSGSSTRAAASLGLPLMIVGRTGALDPLRQALADYRVACRELDRAPSRTGVSLQGYLAGTDADAREQFWPHYRQAMETLHRDRGWSGADDREAYERDLDAGVLLVGSPETVAQTLHRLVDDLGVARVALKVGLPTTGHDEDRRTVELFASATRAWSPVY